MFGQIGSLFSKRGSIKYKTNYDSVIRQYFDNIITRTITYDECCNFIGVNIHNYTRKMLNRDCGMVKYLYTNNVITLDIRQRIVHHILSITDFPYISENEIQLCMDIKKILLIVGKLQAS